MGSIWGHGALRLAAVLVGGLALPGCFFGGTGTAHGGSRGGWPAAVPAIRNASAREQIAVPGGGMAMFFRHTGPFQTAFASLVEDLQTGGWQVLDAKGSLYSQSIAGCGPSCDELRFYAVTRRIGPRSRTVLRVSFGADIQPPVQFASPCVPVALSTPVLDEASRYSPVYDVDLDRDGRLDAYVPRFDGEDVVWDAYAMRGACGHLVGTFPRLPADPHTTAMSSTGLVDLTVAEPRIDEDGRERRVPITYHFDGTAYVPPEPS